MSVEPELLVHILLWGLVIGSIYTLLATGLNIIFGVMKVVNFAHGEFMMIGAYATYWLWSGLGIDPYLTILLSMLLLMGIGLSVERLGFRPIRGGSKINEIFLSLGLIFVVQNVIAYAATPVKPVRTMSQYQTLVLPLGVMSLPYDFVITLFITFCILIGLYLLLTRTKLGRSLRAVSQNRLAATLMGIDVERIDLISFGIGSALAAVAGSIFGILNTFDPYSGTVPAIKAFAIIILGGLGSIPGAVIGGFLYGATESVAAFTLGGSWRDATAFALLTIVLILRPEGLFGKEE